MATDNLSIYSFVISVASIALSAVLGWLKIKEYRRDNRHISVSWNLNGNKEIGDYIYLSNLSSTPILLAAIHEAARSPKSAKKGFEKLPLWARVNDSGSRTNLEPFL